MYFTIDDLFWIFVIYSFVGWCAGVVANALRRKRFINTGFLNLPLCPIYGTISVAYCIFLPELKNNIFFLFLGGSVVAFVIIVVTGAILEHLFHRKWWDYSKSRFQFQGYLNYIELLFFGAGAVLCIKLLNPLILDLVHMLPNTWETVLEIVLAVLVFLDAFFCIMTLFQMHSLVSASFMDHVQDFTENFGNVITRKVQKRMVKAYPNLETEKILTAPHKEKQKEIFAEGCCFYKLAGLFLLGAFLGDIAETIFCRITMGRWMSRSSVVYGPFSIVWGLGCAFLTALLYKYRDKTDRYIFVYGTVLGGAYEYICSVFTELVFGTIFWDYSGIPFNLGGRINLLYCFFWGIAAVVWLKILYPVFSGWIEKIPVKQGKILTWIAIVFMIFNMAISGLALYRYNARAAQSKAQNGLERFLDEHFDDARMERIYPNAKMVEGE